MLNMRKFKQERKYSPSSDTPIVKKVTVKKAPVKFSPSSDSDIPVVKKITKTPVKFSPSSDSNTPPVKKINKTPVKKINKTPVKFSPSSDSNTPPVKKINKTPIKKINKTPVKFSPSSDSDTPVIKKVTKTPIKKINKTPVKFSPSSDSDTPVIKKVTKTPIKKKILTPSIPEEIKPKKVIPTKEVSSDEEIKPKKVIPTPSFSDVEEKEVVSKRVSPTGKKIRLVNLKAEEWLLDEPIDYSLKETEIMARTQVLNKDNGTWMPNSPFILHFLLDGFITDNLGNNKENVNMAFKELLTAMNTPWSNNMVTLLDNAKNLRYYPFEDIQNNKDPILKDIISNYSNSTRINDCIVIGGYNDISGGHIVSFRFDRYSRRIIYINSGQGLDKEYVHTRSKDKYKLYTIYQLKDDNDYDIISKLMAAAIKSNKITNIEEVYDYQVTLDKFKSEPVLATVINRIEKVKLEFKDTGVVKDSRPIYMTDRANWKIKDGELYCMPQLTGTCSFHALYWQLLLDIWLREGSMAASEFEASSRNLVLDNLLNVGPYFYFVGERISCLGLLLRLYPNMKRHDQAIQTLLYNNIEEQKYSISKYQEFNDYNIENKTLSMLKLLPDLINKIKNSLTIEDSLLLLYNIHRVIIDDDEVKHYNWKIKQMAYGSMIMTIKMVKEKPVSKDNTTPEMFGKYCRYIQPLINYKSYEIGDLISIVAKLYNNLPSDDKLPPRKTIIRLNYNKFGEVDCLATNFISNHLDYIMTINRSNQLDDTKKTDLWIKNTVRDDRYLELSPMIELVGNKQNSMNSYIYQVFDQFINTNMVANYVLAIIHTTYNGGVGQSPKMLGYNPEYDYNYDNISVDSDEQVLNIISDLNSGIDIQDISTPNFSELVSSFTHVCGEELDPYPLNKGGNTKISEYNINKKEWCKKAILKALPQLGKVATNHDILIVVSIWMFYLWPEGPTTDMKEILKKLTDFDKRSDILNLILAWGVHIKYLPTFNPIFMDKTNYWDHKLKDTSVENPIQNSISKLPLLIRLFMGRPSRDPPVFLEVIRKWSIELLDENPKMNLITVIEKIKTLTNKKLYPRRFRDKVWRGAEKGYEENGWNLINPFNLQTPFSLDNFYHRARRLEVISCLWLSPTGSVLEINNLIDEKYLISTNKTGFTLTTPNGDVYDIVEEQKTPYLMRKWFYGFEACLALPLRKDAKWYIFMAGGNKDMYKKIKGGCFDKGGFNFIESVVYNCYILEMQPTHLMPIINRNSDAWLYLYFILTIESRATCLGLIYNTISTIAESKNIKIVNCGTPLFNVDKADRIYYTRYLQWDHDLPIPQDGSHDYKLAYSISGSVYNLNVDRLLPLLINLTYKNNNRQLPLLRKSQAMFEAITSKFLYPHQVDLILAMKEDLYSKQSKVRIALMGIGKSKIIVPMLIIIGLLNIKKIQVIQPVHLIPQSLATMDEIIAILPNLNYSILSDTKAKDVYLKSILDRKPHDNNMITLFDEIDSIYNCLTSRYNLPTIEAKHPIEDMPLDLYYHMIVRDAYGEDVDLDIKDITKNTKFMEKYKRNIKMANTMKYKYNYGMNIDDLKELIPIPYSAVDTPIPGSMFSDIDLTAILTCYSRIKEGLTEEDCKLALNKFKYWYTRFNIEDLNSFNLVELLKLSSVEMKTLLGKDKNFQILYLENILLPTKLKCHKWQHNISFMDLMSVEYSQQRIGFSGTDAIHLPEFKSGNWYEIVPDLEGEKKIRDAILGWGKEDKEVFLYSLDYMWSKLQNYDVLIDADAILREEGSSLEIVKRWSQEVKGDYLFIYLDNKHNPLIYDPANPDRADYYIYNPIKKYKHYFDQKHTIGIDLKLHPTAVALTLVGKTSRLVNVAQAIYRLRQIAPDGQTTDFMIENKPSITNRLELYNLIKDNDDKFKQDLLPEHFIQNAKTVERLATNNIDKYMERVKYYDEDISNYVYTDPLAKEIFDEGRDLVRNDIPLVELQMEQEQEQEQEQEKEKEKLNIYNAIKCGREFLKTKDKDYLNPNAGKKFGKNIPIVLSYYIIKQNTKVETDSIEKCFIELGNGMYKIILIREALLLESRFIIAAKYHYRYDPVDEKTDSGFLLAQAFCGRHLLLHEQLKIIKEIKDKEGLLEIANCYHTIDYDIFVNYLNTKLDSVEYLKDFKKKYNYTTFLSRWVNLRFGNKMTKHYYNKCMAIIG
jgi:hypothetical protein